MSSPITEEGGDVEGGEMKKVALTEIDPEMPDPVVIDMQKHNAGQMGGTMWLGRRCKVFMTDTTHVDK